MNIWLKNIAAILVQLIFQKVLKEIQRGIPEPDVADVDPTLVKSGDDASKSAESSGHDE